jgi:hypothetical protein
MCPCLPVTTFEPSDDSDEPPSTTDQRRANFTLLSLSDHAGPYFHVTCSLITFETTERFS